MRSCPICGKKELKEVSQDKLKCNHCGFKGYVYQFANNIKSK